MSDFYVQPGDEVRFSKTVGESDVYLFAGITGDFAGNHVNEEYMKKSSYGRRIAHGALMIGFMSTLSSRSKAPPVRRSPCWPIRRSMTASGPVSACRRSRSVPRPPKYSLSWAMRRARFLTLSTHT